MTDLKSKLFLLISIALAASVFLNTWQASAALFASVAAFISHLFIERDDESKAKALESEFRAQIAALEAELRRQKDAVEAIKLRGIRG